MLRNPLDSRIHGNDESRERSPPGRGYTLIRTVMTPLRIIISGSSGFVGSALTQRLRTSGHEIFHVTRSASDDKQHAIEWDLDQQTIDSKRLEAVKPDVVIHLAGENIAGRWTAKKKKAILESRIKGTRLLAEAVATLPNKPQAFICASAVGVYGDRGNELLDESSQSGSGFLADVVIEWEKACEPARQAGIRVVNTRFGLILSPLGGALGQMLTPFKLGVAGVIGSGEQWWSWVALNDVVSIIEQAMTDERYEGPINVVSPNPVTNRDFTKTLGKVLHRPTIAPMPAFAAKLAFGKEMAEETMLASAKIEPARLREIGYEFQYPQLEEALRTMLG